LHNCFETIEWRCKCSTNLEKRNKIEQNKRKYRIEIFILTAPATAPAIKFLYIEPLRGSTISTSSGRTLPSPRSSNLFIIK